MKHVSIIIPARNEVASIDSTLDAIRSAITWAARTGRIDPCEVEVIVVDNSSTDGTADRIAARPDARDVAVHQLDRLGAARARNAGVQASTGRLLLFVDADTLVPESILARCIELADVKGYRASMFGLEAKTPTVRGRIWWWFWNTVRHLPLARAKALPALMMCTREAFDALGPFDESVAIGEEWPILAGLYRADRSRLYYDHATYGRTSGRRMELRRFGYTRLYVHYAFAILFRPLRTRYCDHIRERAGA